MESGDRDSQSAEPNSTDDDHGSNNVSNHGDESSSDLTHSFHGFELHAMNSLQSHGAGPGRNSHQAQLRRQATTQQQPPSSAPLPTLPRPPPAIAMVIDQESLVMVDRETRELTIDSDGDRRRGLSGVVSPLPDRSVTSNNNHSAASVRNHEGAPINLYYEGQRLALQGEPFSDPELAQPSSPSQAASGWSVVSTVPGSLPPCPRSLHSAAVLNGALYIFGGYNGQVRVNDFHAYSFATRRWSPVLAAANSGRPPSPRDRHVSVVHGSTFYVFGGFNGTSRTNDFFGFDFTSMTWKEINARIGRPPSERHSHASVVHGNSMYVFGGYDGSYKSDLHEFDFTLSKWSAVSVAGRRPRSRYRATCVVHMNQILLFGGHDGTRHLSDTHVFDIEARIWSSLVTDGTPPIPRDSHISCVWNHSMYIFGGSSGAAMSDLHELQLSLNSSSASKWRELKSTSPDMPGPRFCHVAVSYQDSMYIFGGYDGSERLNDFIRFDFAAYDLNFEVPPSTLVSDLRGLVDDDTMSDITFIVENQPIYAHKLMLMRSPYFRALFLGDMRESRLSTIRIEEVRHSVFLCILEYLYTDTVRINLEEAMELFEAADLYCIPRLKTMCEKRMIQSINVETAATIFHAADMHTATALRRKALKFIVAHFEEVSKTESFEEMGRSNMELVFEVLRNR